MQLFLYKKLYMYLVDVSQYLFKLIKIKCYYDDKINGFLYNRGELWKEKLEHI